MRDSASRDGIAAKREEALGSVERDMTQRRKGRGELAATDHEQILNNPRAEAAIARMAIERAVRGGMSRECAERLYGIGRTPCP